MKYSTLISTEFGKFTVSYYKFADQVSVSLSMGDLSEPNLLVRIQSSCLFSESFHSADCDCSLQLTNSMKLINKEGRGLIIYSYEEGRGIGLGNKIKALEIQRVQHIDTTEAFNLLHYDQDPRQYTRALIIMDDLNVSKEVRLITNNPRKIKTLEENGYQVVERIELKYPVNAMIKKYLRVKRDKLGHIISKELTD